MPQISVQHKLYLYKLWRDELGLGKQELVGRYEDCLVEADILPQDLGFEAYSELFDALPDLLQQRVFKKGRIYLTLLPQLDFEVALDQPEEPVEKANGAGAHKSWKKKKSSKVLKAIKPKPNVKARKALEEAALAELAEAEVPEVDEVVEFVEEPQVEAEAQPEETLEPEESLQVETEETELEQAEVDSEPEPDPAVEAEPEVVAEAEAETADEAEEQEPAESRSFFNLEITYVPETPEELEAGVEKVEEEPVQAAPDFDWPQDFNREVKLADQLILELSNYCDYGQDPRQNLIADYEVARKLDKVEGSRASFSFPLRYLNHAGQPLVAQVKRQHKDILGRLWFLSEILGADLEESQPDPLEGLPKVDLGSWQDLSLKAGESASPTAFENFVHFAEHFPLEESLEKLSKLCADESWSFDTAAEPNYILRDILINRINYYLAHDKAQDKPYLILKLGLYTADAQELVALYSNKGTSRHFIDFYPENTAQLAQLDAQISEAVYAESKKDYLLVQDRPFELDLNSILKQDLDKLAPVFLDKNLSYSELKADANLFNELVSKLKEAAKIAYAYMQESYTAGQAIYSPEQDELCWLAPLMLDGVPRFAFVLRQTEGAVFAYRVLELKRAGVLARSLAKHVADWLQ